MTGKEVFKKIFGEHAARFASGMRAMSPGMSEKAIYAPYDEFYSKEELLSLDVRLLITISSLVSQGELDDLNKYVLGALNVGCSPVEISETILQVGIYVGEPKAHAAMNVFSTQMTSLGIDLNKEYETANAEVVRLEPAQDIYKTVFGEEKAIEIQASLRELSPQLERFVIDYPFGEFYAKKHLLDLKKRELITVASLVTTAMLPQLELHIGAAYLTGCTLTHIEQTILQMSVLAGIPTMLNSMKVFNQVGVVDSNPIVPITFSE